MLEPACCLHWFRAVTEANQFGRIQTSSQIQQLSESEEWVVADRLGAFAMGTASGLRTRKYHGFFQGIAGRAECAGLADFEMQWGDQALWPHRYRSPSGESVQAGPALVPHFEIRSDGSPIWKWEIAPGAQLEFSVEAIARTGIRLAWKLSGRKKSLLGSKLRIRPFFAMRNLHALGGDRWEWQALSPNGRVWILGEGGRELVCDVDPHLLWKSDPVWYERFEYQEEASRGYDSCENLYSEGVLELDPTQAAEADWVLSWDAGSLDCTRRKRDPRSASRVQDFVLEKPAGVVAGYPWFGEWGRDTFISLPGIVAAKLHDGESMASVLRWSGEILEGWGRFVDEVGMLPNVVEKEGIHQWESADATLWWTHSLASIWQFSLHPDYKALEGLVRSQQKRLEQAIAGIRAGKHSFLRMRQDGLLEVQMPHVTWMDARIDGKPVTPRLGLVPEINALWFQAQALQQVLFGKSMVGLRDLSHALRDQVKEFERPNRVFFHSLPLSPSFTFQDLEWLRADVERLEKSFWTPMGLRTLDPQDPQYSSSCFGSQRARDGAYHQGPAWAWLASHFEMAKARLGQLGKATHRKPMLTEEALALMPVRGHIAELFDGEAPFTARGAPAQAWSLACLEEHRARQRKDLDSWLFDRVLKLERRMG